MNMFSFMVTMGEKIYKNQDNPSQSSTGLDALSVLSNVLPTTTSAKALVDNLIDKGKSILKDTGVTKIPMALLDKVASNVGSGITSLKEKAVSLINKATGTDTDRMIIGKDIADYVLLVDKVNNYFNTDYQKVSAMTVAAMKLLDEMRGLKPIIDLGDFSTYYDVARVNNINQDIANYANESGDIRGLQGQKVLNRYLNYPLSFDQTIRDLVVSKMIKNKLNPDLYIKNDICYKRAANHTIAVSGDAVHDSLYSDDNMVSPLIEGDFAWKTLMSINKEAFSKLKPALKVFNMRFKKITGSDLDVKDFDSIHDFIMDKKNEARQILLNVSKVITFPHPFGTVDAHRRMLYWLLVSLCLTADEIKSKGKVDDNAYKQFTNTLISSLQSKYSLGSYDMKDVSSNAAYITSLFNSFLSDFGKNMFALETVNKQLFDYINNADGFTKLAMYTAMFWFDDPDKSYVTKFFTTKIITRLLLIGMADTLLTI